jgi:EF-hand domain pair
LGSCAAVVAVVVSVQAANPQILTVLFVQQADVAADVTDSGESLFPVVPPGYVTEEEAEAIFASLDVDNSGTINFTKFVAGCLGRRHINEKTVQTAFDRLDVRHTGAIELQVSSTLS